MRVVRAGMQTTVQDLGRRGYRSAGVPLGGAADSVAIRIANWLVGNHENAPALEFTVVGPELEFSVDTVIALGGAEFGGHPCWQPRWVAAGTRLSLGTARGGCRGYLAVAGGFQVEPVLGSSSTNLRAGFGGWEGRALREGDTLPVQSSSRRVTGRWRIDERILPAYSTAPTVRVVRGAHAGDAFSALLASAFVVTPRSDRMGLRLAGPVLNNGEPVERVSTAVAPGTIQLPSDGQPIVLLADAPTIGGYAQIAHAITVDLPLLAQLNAGDRVNFCEVSLEEAQRRLLAREHALSILHEGLQQKIG